MTSLQVKWKEGIFPNNVLLNQSGKAEEYHHLHFKVRIFLSRRSGIFNCLGRFSSVWYEYKSRQLSLILHAPWHFRCTPSDSSSHHHVNHHFSHIQHPLLTKADGSSVHTSLKGSLIRKVPFMVHDCTSP